MNTDTRTPNPYGLPSWREAIQKLVPEHRKVSHIGVPNETEDHIVDETGLIGFGVCTEPRICLEPWTADQRDELKRRYSDALNEAGRAKRRMRTP